MKSAIRSTGNHYFDKETEEFWGSQVLTAPDNYGFFIESIDDFYRTCKRYNIKLFSPFAKKISTIRYGLNSIENASKELVELEIELARQSGIREKEILSNLKEIVPSDVHPDVYTVYANSGEAFEINVSDLSRLICG